MTFEFTPEQILILGFAASIIVLVLRFVIELLSRNKVEFPEWAMNSFVFVVALGFALFWFPMTGTPLPVPPVFDGDYGVFVPAMLAFLGGWLALLTGALSFAVFIYKYLIVIVKDKLGQAILPKLYPKTPVKK